MPDRVDPRVEPVIQRLRSYGITDVYKWYDTVAELILADADAVDPIRAAAHKMLKAWTGFVDTDLMEEALDDLPDFDGHPGGCVYPHGACTCPVLEHNHPGYVSVTGCAACADSGEEALLRRAERIKMRRQAMSEAAWRQAMGRQITDEINSDPAEVERLRKSIKQADEGRARPIRRWFNNSK